MTRILLGLALGALTLLAATAFANPATAMGEPNVGCGGQVVEACFPVCVTEPCPAFVCVHTSLAEACRELSP